MSAPLDSARWQRLSVLFDRALDLDAAGRASLIAAECGDDAVLRERLQAMLAAVDEHSPLDSGAGALAEAVEAQLPAVDEATAHAGQRFGGWMLDGELGRGGMGVVYAAHRDDGDTLQRAAIKTLRGRWDGSAQAQRFAHERRILAKLSHPDIPRLLDHGVDADARPWIALEFIDGPDLLRWADQQRLDLRDRIDLFRRVCAAVQHAHEHFVVHRDLKPSNILVDAEGHPKVLDFGVAKRMDAGADATRTGMAAGYTPQYAAPEQVTGGAITAATDVYALGVILYQLLSGRLPYVFDADNLRALADAVTAQPAERLDKAIAADGPEQASTRLQARSIDAAHYRRFVRGDLARIVQTALAKEPQRRYSSVQALSADLKRFLEGRTVSVSGDGWRYRAGTFVRRNRWAVAMASLAGLALIAGIVGIAQQSRRAQAQAVRANAEAQRAERETARAQAEVKKLSAVNMFLNSVFSGADPQRSGSTRISLEQALDTAVTNAKRDQAHQPQLQLRVYLAAANSYMAMDQPAKAEDLLRDALAIQQRALPQAREDRGWLLSALAYLRANYEPKQALAWAKEAVRLQKTADPVNYEGVLDALSTLVTAQYVNDDEAGALQTTEDALATMRSSGMAQTDGTYIGALSSKALMQAALQQYDAAIATHRQVIELRSQTLGANSTATALERMYYANTLNKAARYPDALQQLDSALPVLRTDGGANSEDVMNARLQRGIALVLLDRADEALRELADVHVFARSNSFEQRQSVAGNYYLRALRSKGDCTTAARIRTELAQRKIDVDDAIAVPARGNRCP